jgi:hypothetical protein
LGDPYTSGADWVAFNGKLQETEEKLIVKCYKTDDVLKRRVFYT